MKLFLKRIILDTANGTTKIEMADNSGFAAVGSGIKMDSPPDDTNWSDILDDLIKSGRVHVEYKGKRAMNGYDERKLYAVGAVRFYESRHPWGVGMTYIKKDDLDIYEKARKTLWNYWWVHCRDKTKV